MVLLLDGGWSLGSVAEALGLHEATVYRYVCAFTDLGLAKCLAHEQTGYRGWLTSVQLVHLCREVECAALHRRSRLASMAAHVSSSLFTLGLDGPAAPTGLYL